MRRPLYLLLVLLLTQSCQQEITGDLSVKDQRMLDHILPSAQLDTLASGYEWSEGPVWVASEEMLLWSDVPTNTIYQWKPDGTTATYLRPSGYLGHDGREGSNGLIINKDGELVLCQHGERILSKMQHPVTDPFPRFIPIATHYQGKRFNSPNDVIQASDNSYFFTDPPYGLPQQEKDPERELSWQGVYKTHVDRQEYVYLIDSSLSRPNGLALSPDERYLYVANSDKNRPIWMRYELSEDLHKVVGKEVFFDASTLLEGRQGLPDGLKIKSDGTLFATGPGGVLVFDPDGTHLGTIETGQPTSNCAFNTDESKLFITADSYVFSVDLL